MENTFFQNFIIIFNIPTNIILEGIKKKILLSHK
jgi:hypothetical protein